MNRWDTPAYQRISRVTHHGDDLVVLFEDGAQVSVDGRCLLRPQVHDAAWESLEHTPYEILVPTAGDPVQIPWSTIRALTDREYSAHLAAAAEEQARQIGRRIRTLRESRHLTSKELAARAGLAPLSLSRIELGHHDVVFRTLQRILAAMGYSLKDLAAAEHEPVSATRSDT